MVKHRVHIGFQVIEYPRHLDEALFDRIQSGQQYFTAGGSWFVWHGAAIEHRVKVLRVPAKCDRQRFQGAPAAAALNGVPLDFPDNGRRYMRTLSKLTLLPSQLSYALIDGFGDCRPILRHSILRRSKSGAEASGTSTFRGRSQPSIRHESLNSSHRALISAICRRYQRSITHRRFGGPSLAPSGRRRSLPNAAKGQCAEGK
jgi:hypothetical protein